MDLFDFVSDLVLIHIISFLPFKEAAKTSILSKRWRYIWQSTKSIEFDETFFMRGNLLEGDDEEESQRRDFIEFARKWMMKYQEPKVDKFRLSFGYPNEFNSEIEQWIRVVINRKVDEIDLNFYGLGWEGKFPSDPEAFFDIPFCLFKHRGLQSLSLSVCNLNISMFKNLSSLKNLSLGYIRLSQRVFEDLVSNCPSLETLNLKNCVDLEDIKLYEGTETRLRKLCICDCSPLQSRIKISLPSLRFFKYFGSIRSLELQHLPSIEKAELEFKFAYIQSDKFRYFLYLILPGLHLVKCLTVCSYVTQVLPKRTLDFIPPSKYLETKHLILKDEGSSDEFDFKGFCKEREMQVRFCCLRENLKVIKVEGFLGFKYEEELLQYLMKEAQVLERISISTCKEMDIDDEPPDLYFQKAQRVLGFERASPNLLVSIQ
ncbi:putative F-box protein At3g29830 [Telopea speciosissima]|uniref:putative F-box protein At3g29830 n=1 Tax=Telopea speciosissima TaxID=54955 RepID=UPI001CC5C792|nr:putative F-box protein At3g29830 [Telopea speciosissima]